MSNASSLASTVKNVTSAMMQQYGSDSKLISGLNKKPFLDCRRLKKLSRLLCRAHAAGRRSIRIKAADLLHVYTPVTGRRVGDVC